MFSALQIYPLGKQTPCTQFTGDWVRLIADVNILVVWGKKPCSLRTEYRYIRRNILLPPYIQKLWNSYPEAEGNIILRNIGSGRPDNQWYIPRRSKMCIFTALKTSDLNISAPLVLWCVSIDKREWGDPAGVALKVARSKTGAPLGTFQHGDVKSIVLLEARIWGSQSGNYEQYYIQGCDVVWSRS
jgi:hypothetical protein